MSPDFPVVSGAPNTFYSLSFSICLSLVTYLLCFLHLLREAATQVSSNSETQERMDMEDDDDDTGRSGSRWQGHFSKPP